MNIDRYTKVVLTVIAIALTVNIFVSILKPVTVTAVGKYDNVTSVRIVGIDESPREFWDSIPVRIE